MDDFTAPQPGVTEADGREGPIADDHPVRANPPINAGVKLIGAARVVRVDQIEVLDHVILGRRTEERTKDYVSLRELGYLA